MRKSLEEVWKSIRGESVQREAVWRVVHCRTRQSRRICTRSRARAIVAQTFFADMGKETLDFIQEMLRHKTTTTTTPQEDASFCNCTSALNEAMSGEPRHQPPPESSGDTGEGRPKETNRVAPPPPPPRQVYDYDFYGNPIERQFKPPPTQLFSPTHRFSVKEGCSESMVIHPKNERKVDEAIRKEVIRHMNKPGFMGGLAGFFSCANPDDDADSTVAKDIENDAELATLFSSIKNAKTRRTLLEFELRSQLNELRRQNTQMEESYKRQIALELSQKVSAAED